jgi:hypothetical protein
MGLPAALKKPARATSRASRVGSGARARVRCARAARRAGEGARERAVLFPFSHSMPIRCGRIRRAFLIYQRNIDVKQSVIRQVKSLSMSCDSIGNLLLTKFSYVGAKESCIIIPSVIVFWLLDHLPVNQDPNLQPPSSMPKVTQQDWDDLATPRALTVNCRQFADSIRMTFELDRKPDLTVVVDRSNIELMRQIMEAYRADLIDLDAA